MSILKSISTIEISTIENNLIELAMDAPEAMTQEIFTKTFKIQNIPEVFRILCDVSKTEKPNEVNRFEAVHVALCLKLLSSQEFLQAGLFLATDVDKDGKVTYAELMNMKQRLSMFSFADMSQLQDKQIIRIEDVIQ